MKTFLQVLALSTLALITSCAHHDHGSCCGNSSQCEMHKDKKCCDDKGQCSMKKDETAAEKK